MAPQPPDFHQHIVSDCGGSSHFRAADFTLQKFPVARSEERSPAIFAGGCAAKY
ncbi:MAG: hypothetical protein WAV72_14890 [Bradyrhizobium sp.]